MKPVIYLALTANILFILWVLFNGMDEGWKGSTPVQIASYSFLIALLLLDCVLLGIFLRRQK